MKSLRTVLLVILGMFLLSITSRAAETNVSQIVNHPLAHAQKAIDTYCDQVRTNQINGAGTVIFNGIYSFVQPPTDGVYRVTFIDCRTPSPYIVISAAKVSESQTRVQIQVRDNKMDKYAGRLLADITALLEK